MARVIVISTGNELIYGSKIDTNSGFISTELRKAGFDVISHIVVGDDRNTLAETVKSSLPRCDVLILSGGLGPTHDDVTVSALQEIFNFDTEINHASLEKMKSFFATIGKDVNDMDLKMVTSPKGALILENRRGLAPGFIIENSDVFIVALPGVPLEMEDMMVGSAIPFLKNKFALESSQTLKFTVVGMKESEISAIILNMGISLEKLNWGMTAEGGITNVYLSGLEKSEISIENIWPKCRELFGDSMLSDGFTMPEQEMLHQLIQKKYTIAVAESCTGGLISKRITDIPGASGPFLGGVVAYSNQSKVVLLSVQEDIIAAYGAVSEEVASSMAEGVRIKMKADIGISTTGIAGPGGGTEDKPVGTVCFGFDIRGQITALTRHYAGSRDRIRWIAANFSLDTARKMLIGGNYAQ